MLKKLAALEDEHPVATRHTIGTAAFSLGIELMTSSKQGAHEAILREMRSRAKNRKKPGRKPVEAVVPSTTAVASHRTRKTNKKDRPVPVEELIVATPENLGKPPEPVEGKLDEGAEIPEAEAVGQSEERDLLDDILESL